MPYTCVLIPGDGIGPEVAQAARKVVDASGAGLEWVERPAGASAVAQGHGAVLPDATVESIREHGIALKGPCTTPIGEGYTSVNVALRKKLVASVEAILLPTYAPSDHVDPR